MLIGYDFLLRSLGPSQPLQATWWMYVVVFVVKDFAGYWVHRWEHKINFYGTAISLHHSSEGIQSRLCPATVRKVKSFPLSQYFIYR